MPFLRMPEGTRCSTVFLPPITSVCPALCPPWNRTTPCAWSVSQSTTFPLPSSPHWVPMTTTFLATVSALAQVAHGPLAGALDERAAECLPDLVVTPAQRDRVGHARSIGRKHHPAVVVISAKIRQVDRHGDSAASGENLEALERRFDFGMPGQHAPGALERRVVSIELRKGKQCLTCRFRHGLSHHAQRRQILALQRFIQFRLELGTDPAVSANRAEHGDVADVEARPGNTARGQRVYKKLLDLQIALDSGVAVDFCADLQGLPSRVETPRPGKQNAPRIAQPSDAFPVQKV